MTEVMNTYVLDHDLCAHCFSCLIYSEKEICK